MPMGILVFMWAAEVGVEVGVEGQVAGVGEHLCEVQGILEDFVEVAFGSRPRGSYSACCYFIYPLGVPAVFYAYNCPLKSLVCTYITTMHKIGLEDSYGNKMMNKLFSFA
jgi:hypothetical protein